MKLIPKKENKLNKNISVALDFDNLDLALETTKNKDEIAGVKVVRALYNMW